MINEKGAQREASPIPLQAFVEGQNAEGANQLAAFLADSIPYYMMVDIICAYLRNCASAPNFLKRRKALA